MTRIADGVTATLHEALCAHYDRLAAHLAQVGVMIDAGDLGPATEALIDLEEAVLWHIGLEEEIVVATAGMLEAGKPRQVMTREHVRIVELLGSVRSALDERNPTLAIRLQRALGSILVVHRLKEDHVLFREVDARLPARVREHLRSRLEARGHRIH